jgi:hypothetical protein
LGPVPKAEESKPPGADVAIVAIIACTDHVLISKYSLLLAMVITSDFR